MATEFNIGDIIDEMQIQYFEYNKYNQRVAYCKCIQCGRVKGITDYCLEHMKGTSHRACGQYLKTKDKKFYRAWLGIKCRMYNDNYYRTDRYKGRELACDYVNFIDFYDDMYSSYINAISKLGNNISLDRIDNNLGYIKGNLR